MARNTHSSLQGLAIGILSLFAFQLSAQNNFVHQWDHRYGGMMNEHLEVLLQTTDHGFLMAGSSLSTNDGDKSQPSRGLLDYYVVKTDANGLKRMQTDGKNGNNFNTARGWSAYGTHPLSR